MQALIFYRFLLNMRVYIIIPGYNEEKYIGDVLERVLKVTKNIVYVDDGSKDKSVKIARGKTKHVICHKVNLGKGAALKTGCEYAFSRLRADAVIFIDADGQHDPQEIPRFLRELNRGAHVVFGARKTNLKTSPVRTFGNKLASIIFYVFFHKYILDIPSGYKAMTESAYSKIKWKAAGYEVEIEIAARVVKEKIPYRVLEIDAIYHDLDKGMTEIDALRIMKYLVQLRLEL